MARRKRRHGLSWLVVLALLIGAFTHEIGAETDKSTTARYDLQERRSTYPDPVIAIDIAVRHDETPEVTVQYRRESGSTFGFRAVGEESLSLLENEPVRSLDRYQLIVDGKVFDFRNRDSDSAFLPYSFNLQPGVFVPACSSSEGTWRPECTLLGDRFVRVEDDRDPLEVDLSEAKVIELDDDLFVGTSRNERETDGGRISAWRFALDQELDYEYREFDEDDLDRMLGAGMNYFDRINATQVTFLFDKPVFFDVGTFEESTATLFPVLFVHPGFLGVEDFLDEPAYIFWEDTQGVDVANDLAEMAQRQIEATRRQYERRSRGRMPGLMVRLKEAGIVLEGVELTEPAFPIWEEFYDTACYQLGAVPASGFIHEGRYQHPETVKLLNRTFRTNLPVEAETLFRFYDAFLRGAARVHGKDWGMSIYGQADPEIAETALRMAYDRGARFMFFWTSDRDHHVPFDEQLAWAASLTEYRRDHPRPPRDELIHAASEAIVLPYGFTMPISDWDKGRMADLWHRDQFSLRAGSMADGTPYYSVLRTAVEKVEALVRENTEFDIVVDATDLETAGYDRLYFVQPDARRNDYRYPWWIDYYWQAVLTLLVVIFVAIRVRRFVRQRRMGRT